MKGRTGSGRGLHCWYLVWGAKCDGSGGKGLRHAVIAQGWVDFVCRIEIGYASTCVVLLVQPYICQLCVEVICHLRTHQACGQQRIFIIVV